MHISTVLSLNRQSLCFRNRRVLWLLNVLFIFHFDLKTAWAADDYLGAGTAFNVQGTGCNTTVFSQLPNHRDLFLGRQMNVQAGKDDCSGKTWRIVLDRYDWDRRTFVVIQSVITPPLQLSDGSSRILNAYDPDVTEFGGKYWVAFECVGDNIRGTSTCIGSLKFNEANTLELLDAYVVVEGERPGPGYQYTAADPKFLNFNGHLYLYWTAIRKRAHTWISISTRGAELIPDTAKPLRLWVRGVRRAAFSNDIRTSSEVWRGADMMSLREIGGVIYTTASATAGLCLTPSTEQNGCFRLLISRSSRPLGQDAFSRDIAPANRLPTTGQEYARFMNAPDGQLMILGHFVAHNLTWFKQRPVPVGLTAFPVDLQLLFPDKSMGRQEKPGR